MDRIRRQEYRGWIQYYRIGDAESGRDGRFWDWITNRCSVLYPIREAEDRADKGKGSGLHYLVDSWSVSLTKTLLCVYSLMVCIKVISYGMGSRVVSERWGILSRRDVGCCPFRDWWLWWFNFLIPSRCFIPIRNSLIRPYGPPTSDMQPINV